MKIMTSYLAVIVVVLVLLNTYPLRINQDIVFQYKRSSMQTQAALLTAQLADLESLTPENAASVMSVADERRNYRVVVCAADTRVVYDNSLRESAVGRFLLYPDVAGALMGSDMFFSSFKDDSFQSRFAMPILHGEKIIGALYLYDYDSEQAGLLLDLRNQMFSFSIVISLVLAVVSVIISMALTHRFSALLRAIRSVRDGDYGHRAPVYGRDELADVAGQFNELSARLQKTESLRQQFVSDASHELKTPLASVRLLADSILQNEDMDSATLREFITDIGDEIDRLTRLTEKMMQLTRIDSGSARTHCAIRPADVIRRAAHMLTPFAKKAGAELQLELDDDCAVTGDADDLYLIIYNLMENAVKYNRPDGTVRALCYTQDGKVLIVVDDTGVGIPEEDLPRIFERFYRVDKTRSREAGGTGLGLAVVWQTLRAMGGEVKAESVYGKGTRFTVTFPQRNTPPEVENGE
jgi:signal transduction histidine kinase